MRGKGIFLTDKKAKKEARNAEKRFKRVKSNPTKWELEQIKMKQLQKEYLDEHSNRQSNQD